RSPVPLPDLSGTVEVEIRVHVPQITVAEPCIDQVVVQRILLAPRTLEVVKHEPHDPGDDEVADVALPDEPLRNCEEAPADGKGKTGVCEQRRRTRVHPTGLIDRVRICGTETAHRADGVEGPPPGISRGLRPRPVVADLEHFTVIAPARPGEPVQVEPHEYHRQIDREVCGESDGT